MRVAALALLCLAAPSGSISTAATAASPAAARDVGAADPLRKVLLDTLRPTIERDLSQKKLVFVVRTLRTQGDWAFADVAPRTPAGRPVDFRKTRHAERLRLGMLDDDTVFALLKRSGGRWKVVTFAVGPTDVAWDGWDEEFGAPRTLFAVRSD
jgi:hypothetical protein